MRELEYRIYMAVMMKDKMTMSQIQAECINTPERTVYRTVRGLVESGKFEHKRIPKHGKRRRYFIKEEEIKTDITMRAFKKEAQKKGLTEEQILALEIRPRVTQRNLSRMITEEKRFYNKTLQEMKQFGEHNEYYFYHISMISNALEWITKQSMAIESGMIGDSPNKLDLARRNKERYEEWLKQLCDNIKVHNKKLGEEIIRTIQGELVDYWFMEKLL